ncbi:MAG TPA: beta-propeller fold lactonase family protein [Solirubrobacterales bacterium]|jgi:YVTN family beta-propeller protein|nr:beta-propeller fold lactonase family protein [Solirubrobacterales bacterium]
MRTARSSLILTVIGLVAALFAASAEARLAYVGNVSGGVSAIDTATNQAIEVPDGNRLIQAGVAPRGIALTPDGKFAYVANGAGVSVIDTATNRAIDFPDGGKLIKTGGGTLGIAITPDGRFAYVTHEIGGVSVIDTATNRAIEVPDGNKLIKTGNGFDVAITPDGKFAYVANGSGGVSVIDTATNQTVEVPEGNKLIQAASSATGVAITPDGRFAYVTSFGASGVFVIDIATNRPVRFSQGETLIPVGPEPREIAVTPNGRFAYVTHLKSGVSVIDTATNRAIEVPDGNMQINAGTGSAGLAVTPDGRFVYVTNLAGGVFVIDTATNRKIAVPDGNSISAGTNPVTVAIAPNQPPLAFFRSDRARPGVPVTFDATLSRDPDSPIASYAWSFGDGGSQTLTSPTVSHVFAPGVYQVTLRESDAEGCSTPETFSYLSSSVLCNGKPSAQITRTIEVAYPGVNLRCPKRVRRGGCSIKLFAISRKPRKDHRAKPESGVVKVRLGARKSVGVILRPKPAFAAKLAAASRILVKETVRARGTTTVRYPRLRVVQ